MASSSSLRSIDLDVSRMRAAWARSLSALLFAPWLVASCGGVATSTDACLLDEGDPKPAAELTCHGEAPASGPGVSIAVRETIHGDNGSFTDVCVSCDALLHFSCEESEDCDDQGFCEPSVTGSVAQEIIACPCADGRCQTGCPEIGSPVHVEIQADESGIVTDELTGKRYACGLAACNVGAAGTVSSVAWTGLCTEGKGRFAFEKCLLADCALLP